MLDVIDGLADENRLVALDGNFEICGESRPDLIELCHDRIDYGHGVGTGLLPYFQGDRRLAVDSGDPANFLYRVDHTRDIAQFNNGRVLLREDDARKIGNIRQAAHRPESDFRRAGDKTSTRNFNVLALDGTPHLLCRQSVCCQPVGVQQELYLPPPVAIELDTANIVDGFQNLLDLLVNDLRQFLRVPL